MPIAGWFAALAARPGSLQALIDEIPGGLAFFDESGQPLLHNSTLSQILGGVPARVQDVRFLSPAGGDLDGAAAPPARALAGELVSGAELRVRAAGGDPRRVRVTAIPLGGDGDRSGGIALLITEPSDRHAAETLQREILGVIAHDVRNPLSAIRMTAQLMTRPAEMEIERRITLAERILSSTKRLEAMARALADFARAREGALIKLERQTVDLGEMVARLAQELVPTTSGRTVRQQSRGDLAGHWDPDRLEQVMGNLIGNAVRHGEGTITLLLDGTAPDTVTVSVHNEGPPIPEEALAELFDPFAIGPREGGTPRHTVGLGLFVARRFVTAHEGTIDVSSSTANGTTFVVSLPRGPSDVTER